MVDTDQDTGQWLLNQITTVSNKLNRSMIKYPIPVSNELNRSLIKLRSVVHVTIWNFSLVKSNSDLLYDSESIKVGHDYCCFQVQSTIGTA